MRHTPTADSLGPPINTRLRPGARERFLAAARAVDLRPAEAARRALESWANGILELMLDESDACALNQTHHKPFLPHLRGAEVKSE